MTIKKTIDDLLTDEDRKEAKRLAGRILKEEMRRQVKEIKEDPSYLKRAGRWIKDATITATKNYWKNNVTEYKPNPEQAQKNKKKAGMYMGSGVAIGVISQVPYLGALPFMWLPLGIGLFGYGGMKGYQFLKDRKEGKRRTEERENMSRRRDYVIGKYEKK
ncbi:hypothetical protein COV93_07645 [Candidatus Woesearchaeota archaeon CG11_big_fil_rev_8_21_14_0_20_43_8]|nr:MAG: hypothetical protein COV93_07645 [Candidatus Woesearchaeota archaeon CG11_big_fil_rev_8_21_14_0_20_43_8]PIO06670.1 MAG: hypothetical protein COT47_03260 [Candidatus Woesearchaeota archaeon CG08_land_8_20_14_0_20_43_7]